MNKKLRVLVVDDSIVFRKVVRDCFKHIPNCDVIDVAKDGEAAIAKIRHWKPDLVTLDFEMPNLNGLDVLEAIQDDPFRPRTLLLSSHAIGRGLRHSEVVGRAIALGADDYLLKPDGNCTESNFQYLHTQLRDKISAIRGMRDVRPTPTDRSQSPAASSRARSPVEKTTPPTPPANSHEPDVGIDAVCIGVSTGGPAALAEIMPEFSASFPVPIFVVQHMPAGFTAGLAEHLNSISKLSVFEGEHGMPVRPGQLYLAPGGRHMGVVKSNGQTTLEVNTAPPIGSCRPSVDYLFRSVMNAYRQHVLSLVMTGMGTDGLDGAREIRKRGGRVWTQSEETCVVYGMPRAIEDAKLNHQSLPLGAMVQELSLAVTRKSRIAPIVSPTTSATSQTESTK